MKKQTAIFILLFVTLIWGGGFPATRMALDFGVTVGITNAVRGFIFTVLVFLCFPKQILSMSKSQAKLGLLVGLFNFFGFLFQTIGAKYTTPSNNAFLTTTNVVMVPFLAWLLLKQKPKAKNFIAVGVCLVGMAVLTGMFDGALVLNIGDVYTILCAFAYAVSIVLLAKQPESGHFAASAFLLGFTHFIGGFLYFLIAEKAYIPSLDWKIALLPVIYLGLGSSFIAQSLQVIVQKYLNPSTVCLIMMLEGVWGSIFSVLFGYEHFTYNLIIGGALIVASLVLSEIQVVRRKSNVSVASSSLPD